jgi:hypothetical protein
MASATLLGLRPKLDRAMIATAVLLSVSVIAATVAVPLLVYSMTLATFGAAHVVSELRYIDYRFGRRLGIPYAAVIGPLLAGAMAARASGVFGLLNAPTAVALELSFVVALALTAARGKFRQRALALGITVALGVSTLASPFDTAISLSILHNLTPLAFLWEISQPGSRRFAMTLALIAFVGLPVLVATGLPRMALASVGIAVTSIDPIGAGALAGHLYIYVPAPLLGLGSAIDLFSASVVAQCAHYAAVILVLPVLLAARNPEAIGIVAWPRGKLFLTFVVVLSSIALYRFTIGFVSARALYGIAASLHAWLEIPIVIIAVTRTSHASRIIPASIEAPLAIAETNNDLNVESPVVQAMIAASTRMTNPSVQPSVDQ